jgi:hypothetical protein
MWGEGCVFHEVRTVVLKSLRVIAAWFDTELVMAVAQRSAVKRVAAT